MSLYSQPTFWQKLTRSLRALSISVRRLFFHLRLRYRNVAPAERKIDFDAESSGSELATFDSQADSTGLSKGTRAGFLLSSNREATDLLTEEKQTHDDHFDDELDSESFEPTELDALAGTESSESVLAGTAALVSSQSQSRATTKTRLAAASEDSSEDVSAGWLNEWFGPTSPRRNAWLFSGVTGVLGMILALLLLFSGHRPSQNPEEISLASGSGQPDPFAEIDRDDKPDSSDETKPPFEEIELPEPEPEPIIVVQPEPKTEPKPEPEPEPIVVVELPEQPEPEPKPKPEPEDQFELSVILLPDPDNVDQGELFEVTGTDAPANPDEGFDPEGLVLWRESLLPDEEILDAWKDLERLVPLGPLEPQEVAVEANPQRDLAAEFVTTQPIRSTNSLVMPYEMAVTNRSSSPIDRLRMTQTLPTGLELRSTSAVHAHSSEDRKLTWEFEDLAPLETWRVPMVVIPKGEGVVALQTNLEGTVRVSSQTLVLTPAVKLEIVAAPHAPVNKYHQLLFRITNVGEVPLTKLRMGLILSDNLWHRFGNKFVFHETELKVGEVREALLHVKPKKDGVGKLDAKLTTEEGAETTATIAFGIGTTQLTDQEADSPTDDGIPSRPIGNPGPRVPERRSAPEKKPEPSTESPLIPANTKPAPKPEQPAPAELGEPVIDDFPAFPGALDPLPTKESSPAVPPKTPIPVRRESTEQPDPFELPPKKEEQSPFEIDK